MPIWTNDISWNLSCLMSAFIAQIKSDNFHLHEILMYPFNNQVVEIKLIGLGAHHAYFHFQKIIIISVLYIQLVLYTWDQQAWASRAHCFQDLRVQAKMYGPRCPVLRLISIPDQYCKLQKTIMDISSRLVDFDHDLVYIYGVTCFSLIFEIVNIIIDDMY